MECRLVVCVGDEINNYPGTNRSARDLYFDYTLVIVLLLYLYTINPTEPHCNFYYRFPNKPQLRCCADVN